MRREDQKFKVMRMGSNVEKEFSQVDLANIIEPRMQEIFQLIRQEVHRLGYGDKVNGYVLTGGRSRCRACWRWRSMSLELLCALRFRIISACGILAFTSGVGMIQYVSKYMRNRADDPARKKSRQSAKQEHLLHGCANPDLFEQIEKYV